MKVNSVPWRSSVLKRQKTLFVTLAIAALFASGAIAGAALPSQKQATPKPQATQKSQGKLALAESEVVQLLLLMETNKNGKISEQECMKFMETEVDRLDRDNSGDLHAKDLKQSKLRVSHPVIWESDPTL
jgi:hypothetical protein